MSNIPAKVIRRFNETTKRFTKILEEAKVRDINESDTVKIIYDILSDVFGYDKYLEITSEFQIRGTYCDLAIKDENDKIRYLIECKAIGSELKENHLRQAIDYASRAGIDWTILTNGVDWEIYKVIFNKPVDKKLIFKFNLLLESVKDNKFTEKLYLLSKEALKKSAIESFDKERKALDKYTIAAILQSDDVTKIVRSKLRSIFKDVSINKNLIEEIIRNDILKRELINSEKVYDASKALKRNSGKKRGRKGAATHHSDTDSDGQENVGDSIKSNNDPDNI